MAMIEERPWTGFGAGAFAGSQDPTHAPGHRVQQQRDEEHALRIREMRDRDQHRVLDAGEADTNA